jgi:hypothetical protein
MAADRKDVMPGKRQSSAETSAAIARVDSQLEQPIPSALADAVLDRVLQCIDLNGLQQKVLDDAATRLAQTVRVDKLTERIVAQQEQELSERLFERVLEEFALGARTSATGV